MNSPFEFDKQVHDALSNGQLPELLQRYPSQEALEEQALLNSNLIRDFLNTPETENIWPLDLVPLSSADLNDSADGEIICNASSYVLERLSDEWKPAIERTEGRPDMDLEEWRVDVDGYLHPAWFLLVRYFKYPTGEPQSVSAVFSTKPPNQLAAERHAEHSILPQKAEPAPEVSPVPALPEQPTKQSRWRKAGKKLMDILIYGGAGFGRG